MFQHISPLLLKHLSTATCKNEWGSGCSWLIVTQVWMCFWITCCSYCYLDRPCIVNCLVKHNIACSLHHHRLPDGGIDHFPRVSFLSSLSTNRSLRLIIFWSWNQTRIWKHRYGASGSSSTFFFTLPFWRIYQVTRSILLMFQLNRPSGFQYTSLVPPTGAF